MLARPAPPQRLDIVFLCANLALLATPPAGFRTSAEVGERVDCLVLASGTAASLLPLLLAPIRALKMVCLWPQSRESYRPVSRTAVAAAGGCSGMWGRHAAGCSASFSSIRASLDSVRPMLSARPICVHQLRMLPVNHRV